MYKFLHLQNVAWLKFTNDIKSYAENKGRKQGNFVLLQQIRNHSGLVQIYLQSYFRNKDVGTLSTLLKGDLQEQAWVSLFWKSATDYFSCKNGIDDDYGWQSHLNPGFNYHLWFLPSPLPMPSHYSWPCCTTYFLQQPERVAFKMM